MKQKTKYQRKYWIYGILFFSFCLIFVVFLFLSSPKTKVGILYVATGKYIMFWDDFYNTSEKYLLPDAKKTYYVWTDSERKFPTNVVKIPIKNPGWPDITLKRYHYFQESWNKIKGNDYVFFFNANGKFVGRVDSEILPTQEQELTVALHPGYYQNNNPNTFPYERRKISKAYILDDKGTMYVAGGMNGGKTIAFKEMIDTIVKWVDLDIQKGVIAIWHDESHLNRYILDKKPLVIGPEYVCPEEYKRYSNLNGIIPKYLLKDKNKYGGHKYMRGEVFIINQIPAGLGNNLFKIATGIAYAKRTNQEACLNGDTYRDEFKNLPRRCTKDDLKYADPSHVCSETLETLLNDKKCTTIEGYNQNPLLFADDQEEIKKAFSFSDLSPENQKIREQMEITNSIALHFRRGDYISSGYPILQMPYYENAVKYIVEKTKKKPYLFLFSNDIKWVQDNFQSNYPYTVV